ncbi:MAG: co-chaperone GroES [Nanobdellota archaeon]
MEIKPIGERVLLKPIEEKSTTAGGIYIPESARESKKQGEVVAIGQKEEGEFPIKPGDKVIYGGYSNEEINSDGEKYIIVELKDIMAKMG